MLFIEVVLNDDAFIHFSSFYGEFLDTSLTCTRENLELMWVILV